MLSPGMVWMCNGDQCPLPCMVWVPRGWVMHRTKVPGGFLCFGEGLELSEWGGPWGQMGRRKTQQEWRARPGLQKCRLLREVGQDFGSQGREGQSDAGGIVGALGLAPAFAPLAPCQNLPDPGAHPCQGSCWQGGLLVLMSPARHRTVWGWPGAEPPHFGPCDRVLLLPALAGG